MERTLLFPSKGWNKKQESCVQTVGARAHTQRHESEVVRSLRQFQINKHLHTLQFIMV
jgi:hypothetical protein